MTPQRKKGRFHHIVSETCFMFAKPIGIGAKSQILSSVAPTRKKKLATIFSQGHVWGPQIPMFY